MKALPMTVIAGYLGAGKTTLINRILADPHGMRLLVMVNDFGAINIDEGLLISRSEDTIALSNGCVCCTMGADLFMAIGDVLDRDPRPDHLIIEASGVSDPARIANAALAEPELSYAGIVTVVDGPGFERLKGDRQIGPQVLSQISQADLVWVSKEPGASHLDAVKQVTAAPVLHDAPRAAVLDLIAERAAPTATSMPHSNYASWSCDGIFNRGSDHLRQTLETRPNGLFRVKGTVRDASNACWGVQVVGRQIDIRPAKAGTEPGLVGIGLASLVSPDAIDAWWSGVSDEGPATAQITP